MSIDIKPGRYFSHWWFVGDGHTTDWMAALWREDKPGAEWHLQYRFRYYKDDKVQDSDDEKRWYEAIAAPDGEEKIIEATDMIARLNELRFGSKMVRVELKSNDPSYIISVIDKLPFMHLQEVSREDAPS